jgi:hypothetical protein
MTLIARMFDVLAEAREKPASPHALKGGGLRRVPKGQATHDEARSHAMRKKRRYNAMAINLWILEAATHVWQIMRLENRHTCGGIIQYYLLQNDGRREIGCFHWHKQRISGTLSRENNSVARRGR